MANKLEIDELEELRKRSEALENERQTVIKQIHALEEQRLEKKRAETWAKIENMTDEEKEYVLNLVPHEYESCGGYSENGWSYSRNRYSCRRCMLEEMFNGEHGGRFDFRFDIIIEENRV